MNYLLASLPPTWARELPRNLLHLESVLERFTYFEGVQSLVQSLAGFLQSVASRQRNRKINDRREDIEQALGFQLPVFAASIQASLEPGWTRDPECRLPLCEQLWLDPERAGLPIREHPESPEWTQQDLEFNAAYEFGDWPDQVAGRFANWVNAQLREAGLTAVGDAEYKHWAKQAIVDAAWPVSLQRRAPPGGQT
ncbi:CRISPR-associated protein, Csy1 family [Dokdonella koreensis DS-123]|uniref:CRISPR-associated protein, Csy1 family n=2 Tax=Dokdonella TaxID=323413 RepID=A0A160DUM8_9GAMM|nr:CRISPR-associated protein, Csy1 family [Dokdonella koreensis DS-123]